MVAVEVSSGQGSVNNKSGGLENAKKVEHPKSYEDVRQGMSSF